MTRLWAFIFIGFAILAAGVTFNATGSLPAQEGGAAAAVAFAVVAGILLYNSEQPSSESAWEPNLDATLASAEGSPGAIEQAFIEGPFGRERIALTLDAVERATRDPDHPFTDRSEIERLRGLKSSEFQRYVAQRLDRLEEET